MAERPTRVVCVVDDDASRCAGPSGIFRRRSASRSETFASAEEFLSPPSSDRRPPGARSGRMAGMKGLDLLKHLAAAGSGPCYHSDRARRRRGAPGMKD